MSSNGKPTPQPPAAAANGAGGPPKMYQRPIYRPQQGGAKRRRGGRSCPFSCCCCFFWTVLVILLLAFIAAVVGGAFYLLYRPHRPAFTLSAARVTKLSLSSSATAPSLTDAIDVTLTAKNPNKKLVYFYDDFAVTAATAANSVPLGEGSVPGFAHEAGNITVIKATVSASALAIDPTASSDIKKSGEFPITLDLETKAGVKVGGLKTKKIGIQVHCESIKVTAPAPPPPAKKKKLAKAAAKAPAPAAAAAATAEAPEPSAAVDDAPAPPAPAATVARVCSVRIRVKIWKWTF
ncbi:unnamed protein product [Urochloa decumbens]|uniref:Late embryogenesis abundant protein LEA-2 subgroup domain-containing protein n=1 Tax=Urochloa decumbens TaxID=240449 RepID=A0ABC8Z075_9POAL